MSDASIIDELELIESASGKLQKSAALRVVREKTLALLAAGVDPWRVWYVSGPPEINEAPGQLVDDDAVEIFMSALEQLQTGELRGSRAHDMLRELWVMFGHREREWFGRVLRKKMRVGVAATLLNAVRPGSVREFNLPLCDSLEATVSDDGSALTWAGKIRPIYPSYADVKLDGLRVLAVRRAPNDDWEMYTRGGDPIETMPGAMRDLKRMIPAELGPLALHGEGYGVSWADSASSIMAKKRSRASDDGGKPLWLFDIVPLDEALGITPSVTPLDERRALLDKLLACQETAFLKLVPTSLVTSDGEVAAAFARAVKIGEGLVVKDVKGTPHLGRSRAWLKLKPIKTWECRITGWFGGKKGTRLDGCFGGFTAILPETGAITEIGSGFSDELRREIMSKITADETAYVDKWVEVEGQPPLTDDGKIRFPVFIRFRSSSDLG